MKQKFHKIAFSVLVIAILVITYSKFYTFTATYEYDLYQELFNNSETGGYFKIKNSGVYYYDYCPSKSVFNGWCPVLLTGVESESFTPLSAHYAKVSTTDGVRVFHNNNDITTTIHSPENFVALEKLSVDPVYFTDGVYIYYFTPRIEDKKSNIFPLKLAPGDTFSVPTNLQIDFNPDACSLGANYMARVLFINNNVYLDGELVPDAKASSFEMVSYDNTPATPVWFKDNENVYFKGHIVYGADPKSFKLEQGTKPHGPINSCPRPDSFVASDASHVYYSGKLAPFLCKTSRFCIVDLRIPDIKSGDISIPSEITEYALSQKETISINGELYYLDGLKKENNEVEALVGYGNHYKLSTQRHVVWYFVNSLNCKQDDEGFSRKTFSEKPYTLFINDAKIQRIEECHVRLDVTMPVGKNDIRIENDDGEIVFERVYTNYLNIFTER